MRLDVLVDEPVMQRDCGKDGEKCFKMCIEV